MRILILGGTTRTGPYAVRQLHSLGHNVTVFHRGEHEAELPAAVRHLHSDLTSGVVIFYISTSARCPNPDFRADRSK
jgi:uncharacterized protein YbjT (DUF2867 family)